MVKSLGFLWRHVYTSRVEPVTAALTLNHEVIRIVWHFTFTVHGNSVRIKRSSRRIVVESAKEIFVTNSVEFGVALECVNRTLAFNTVGALYIAVIGQKQFLRAVKLTSAADRLLRAVIPPDMNLDVATSAVGLNLLNSSNVRRF